MANELFLRRRTKFGLLVAGVSKDFVCFRKFILNRFKLKKFACQKFIQYAARFQADVAWYVFAFS